MYIWGLRKIEQNSMSLTKREWSERDVRREQEYNNIKGRRINKDKFSINSNSNRVMRQLEKQREEAKTRQIDRKTTIYAKNIEIEYTRKFTPTT